MKKSFINRLRVFAAVCIIAVMMLSSCGSALNGTWTSQADDNTKITFSGHDVKISYDSFKTSGTYETDDDGNVVFNLTDNHGNIYKITAKLTMTDDNTFTLKNTDGNIEVFRK